MNFQEARTKMGTFITMLGTATKIDVKEGDYGPYALGNITDANGESVGVLFGSNDKSPLPNSAAIGKQAQWGIKYDANKQKYKAYFNHFAGGDAQQAAPQPARAANTSNGAGMPVDATRLSIERQCAIKSACTFLAGKTEATTQEVADAALLFANFMATGRPFFKGNEDGLMDTPASQDEAQPTKGQPGVTEYQEPTGEAIDHGDVPF